MQKYNVDLERIKEIFKRNRGAQTTRVVEKYAGECIPALPSMTEQQQQKRAATIRLAIKAIFERARIRGWIKPHHQQNASQKHTPTQDKKEKKADAAPPPLPKRRWPEPEIIEIPKEAWDKPGTRVAYISRGDYKKAGFRAGLHFLAAQIIAEEGCHFPVFAGGIMSKQWIKDEIKRLSAGKKQFIPEITDYIYREIAQGLATTLPQLRKPDGTLARWYLIPSFTHDGPNGENIIQLFLSMRPLHIRQYNQGGEKIEVWQPNGKKSIYHGVVLPKKSGRLPSSYFSGFPEREIKDIEEQTHHDFPDLWVVGTASSALYKPSGERGTPYISLPSLNRLEAEDKRIAENQEGLGIVEDMPDGDRLIHFWNFRDLIARERDFITGMKEGATDFHRKINEIIKREGKRHPGRLADELNVERAVIDKEIQFLVEPKQSPRKTYPSLQYDQKSDRYDFHLNWIQETLRYSFPKDKTGWHEDSFFFFGCMHAGYTTTDYEFIVKKFPEIILKYDIQTMAGIGDFIAGLHHDYMHTGQIFYLDNTEQEEFAGEIIATILYKIFVARFDAALRTLGKDTPTLEQLESLTRSSLMLFLIKKGNHDRWQEREGNKALVKFYDTLISRLERFLYRFLAKQGAYAINLTEIIKQKMIMVPEYRPIYTLPSGIKVGLTHPHMARAETTSLRAEKAIALFARKWKCQVVGVANFHTAVFAHKWLPTVGQCVVAQTGTEVILTDFEINKLKDVDFGPLYLKTLSYNGRIFKTTIAAFNKPILTDETIPEKDTNMKELKHNLGLLGY